MSSSRLRRSRPVRAAANARTLWYRRRDALRRPADALRFVCASREVSNFTYEVENLDDLLAGAAAALGLDAGALAAYAAEVAGDVALRSRLRAGYATRADRDDEPRYGKRLVTYAIVRALAPAHIAESGTHDGLGSVLIAAALRRNTTEGRSGRLSTFDPNPEAGWLLSDDDLEFVSRHREATVDALPAAAGEGIDLFIHDSLRTYENERREYEVALAAASGSHLLVLCDCIRATAALGDLCLARDVDLAVLREQPHRHWWPGNSVGLTRIPVAARVAA